MAGLLLAAYVVLRLLQLAAEALLRRANRLYTLDPRRQDEAMRLLVIPREDMDRALAYAADRYRFAQAADAIRVAAGLAFLAAGGLGWVESAARSLAGAAGLGSIAAGLAFFAILGLGAAILGLPFGLYHTFRIEQKHGFNRQTVRGFFQDFAKGLALAAVLGGIVLLAVLWLMRGGGRWWWAWAWAATSAFSVLAAWIYPTLLAPIFNRFTPLPEGELKERIRALGERIGFHARGVYVMDASRRTAHGNAYFTGLGRAKRIVFFDTLIQRLLPPEIEAVLAHELGHFKLKHIAKRLAFSFFASLAVLALLGWLVTKPWFYIGLGVEPSFGGANYGIALVLFMLVMPVFTFVFAPLASMMSRKHEFEADQFAARNASAPDLVNALVKLYEDNASTLTPDPIHSAFYDSHPPASIRIQRLLPAT